MQGKNKLLSYFFYIEIILSFILKKYLIRFVFFGILIHPIFFSHSNNILYESNSSLVNISSNDKKYYHKKLSKNIFDKEQRIISAVFKRFSQPVEYKIKDLVNGKIFKIKVTPDHRFYDIKSKNYLPISKMGFNSSLINYYKNPIKIICQKNKHKQCAFVQLYTLKPVYNLKISQWQNYFATSDNILVHNGCYDKFYRCSNCLETHFNRDHFSFGCFSTNFLPFNNCSHSIRTFFQCEYCGCSVDSTRELWDFIVVPENTELNHSKCTFCDTRQEANNNNASEQAKANADAGHNLFCGICDSYIPLKEKLENKHEHTQNGHLIHKTQTIKTLHQTLPHDDEDFEPPYR